MWCCIDYSVSPEVLPLDNLTAIILCSKDFQRIHSDFTIPLKSLYPESMRVVPEI